MVSLILGEGHSTIRSSSIKVVIKIQTFSCVYPARFLKTSHKHGIHIITGISKTCLLSFRSLFQQEERALAHNIKDLQAHNAQFQQMFLALAKGQEDLKALMIKDKKKKTKKPIGVLNMGMRFREPAK